ncbi:Ubiquitin homeostasis protein lub1 [Cytospora mali]|uniref:Ubiquitin homeostasis protein lub1 n=1 Tax=Cytospora mali TaxID=578113 RepID=A0A194URA3_CYTMA|nr:Ubiquitin homeostasis protein lub1 [Valsa mali var. pyri (nom. inval.)]
MEFKLSAQLSGHESDVRGVLFPSPDTVISASRDHTLRVWRTSSQEPPVFDGSIVTQGQEWLNTLAYLPPTSDYPDGLIVSGGKDTIIEVKKPQSTPADNAERLLIGHAHNICSLDISPKGTYIVSGSWDKQAIVWKVGKWEPHLILAGHDASVWGVLALDETTVVTGAADEKIHIYDLSSSSGGILEPRSTIYTSNVVRAVCKVPRGHPTGADIASAHNDGVIRLWKLNGQSVGELYGHDSFVYSLAALPSGELVSSGEDRTIRIWRGLEGVQTITVPAISVWSVAACQQTGDIVSGSSDGVVRVFTRNEANLADAETLASFDESVKASSIPAQQLGGINKEKLPGPDFLQTNTGTKDGQLQMIRQANDTITAHQWSGGGWVEVGTVVDTVGSSGKKVDYNGKSYDFVFDVAIEDGAPALKLPYNLSQNPYEAATKWLGDNELPMTYLDQVTNFIVENTKGATIGQGSGPSTDAFGTGRYQPGDEAASQQPPAKKILPQENYLTLAQGKFEAAVKKILSVSATMISTGRKDTALNPTEEATLNRLAENLNKTIPSVPATVPGTAPAATSQPLPVSEHDLNLILKLVGQWPDNDRLPGLDILRCMATSPIVADFVDPTGGSVIDVALRAAFHPDQGKVVENCAMMAFRVVTNLFTTEQGRQIAYQNAEKVVDYMECLVGISDTVFQGPVGFPGNRNVLMAVTTAALNYSVLGYLVSKKKVTLDGDVTPEVFGLLGNVLSKIIKEQGDSEVNYRALVTLGTIASVGHADVLKSVGADSAIKEASKAGEDRVKKIAQECLALLR